MMHQRPQQFDDETYEFNIFDHYIYVMIKITLPVLQIPFQQCVINNINFRAYKDGRLERMFKNSWQSVKFTPNKGGYALVGALGKRYLYHRIIYKIFNPTWDIDDVSLLIDHIDRNSHNNAIRNLRSATSSENAWNRTSTVDRKYSGLPKGVMPVYMGNVNKWFWCIRTRVGSGRSKSKIFPGGNGKIPDPLPHVPADVVKERDILIKRYHGEFAVL